MRRRRTSLAAVFLLHLLYAVWNGALGALGRSPWFAAMGAYYAVLAAARLAAVLWDWRGDGERAVRWCGALLVLLSAALAGAAWASLSRDTAVRRDSIVMISIAAYTFVKIGAAVCRAVRGRRERAGAALAVWAIGCAEAAASVFILQRSMLASFGTMPWERVHVMNAMASAAVCAFILALGIVLVRRGGERECQNRKRGGPSESWENR